MIPMKKLNKPLLVLLLAINLGLAAAAYFFLPDTVTTQIGVTGNPSNTMPKVVAILIPLLIGISGVALRAAAVNENNRRKGLFLSLVGIAMFIITFFVNL